MAMPPLLQRASIAVVIHTRDFDIREWNAAAERLFGFTAAEAVGKNVITLLGSKTNPVRKDGAKIACEWHEDPSDDGHTIAFVTDVTPAKNRERLMQVVLENLPIVVWQIDPKGIFLYHDGKKGLESVGLKPGQVVGQDAYKLYGELTAATIDAALAGKPNANTSEAYGMVWHNWTVPLYDEQGHIDGAAGVTLNVTDNARRENELRAKLEVIQEQQNTIRELSIPLIETWEGVLTVPMVGVVDSGRAAEIMEKLLSEIARRKARFAIVDITGVEVIDSAVAGHIISLTRSIKLLGAEGIVTGIRPNIAQTMVQLGVDLGGIRTLGNLREALAYCLGRLRDT